MVEIECGGFIFTSNFESGNLARVDQVILPPKPPPVPGQSASYSDTPDYEFNIWTNPDCAGTEFENSSRSWFYFGVKGGTPFALVKLNLVNLNRQVRMYSQGMAPVYRILPGRGMWDRIRDKPTYTMEDNVFTLSFRYRTLENVRATTYFAFTFPYSYQDLMCSLKNFDKRFKNCTPPEKYLLGQSTSGISADDIYYHRELACHSLDGRRLDLLTITSHHGITSHREPRLKNLFTDLETPRPFIFVGKKVIFVSARVHPGEVPSSYVLNGLLESLLNRDDLTSILLRRMYVFKVIPMLNPDGVARGHFRTDTRGVNLNRVYLNPSLTLHPTIYAARAIIRYAHYGKEVDDDVPPDIVETTSPSTTPSESPRACSNIPDLDTISVVSQQDIQTTSQSAHSLRTHTTSHILPTSASVPQLLLNLTPTSGDVKDNIDMQCDTPQIADEDMLSPDENIATPQGGPVVEMDIEKERAAELGSDEYSSSKNMFSTEFPSDTITYYDTSDSVPAGRVETPSNSLNKAPQRPASEPVHTSKMKGAGLGVSCGEIISTVEGKRRRDPKRKNQANGASRPALPFTRPASRNEEDINEDDVTSIGSKNVVKPSLEPSKSGLFLYMDMHGHASKKGIFMYGNHFDDLDQLVECMLLPKIMSINSQNFHFTACNFTERNMYLRDRKDGMSREGCGRVSVMKMTGLVRSYTLECNYNTGRMVNLLPPCVRDSGRMSVNPAYAVPPKYTPLVFEDVGRALAVSILDLTNSNPCSRVPNSEYRSINGIREWLRTNCLSDNQLWTRMLHRPTRQQVGQSASSQSLAGSSGNGRPVHLTKSVLLARISTELKTLGEEYARREHLKIQKTASCSQLDSLEGISSLHPKENIGPGQCGARALHMRRSDSSSLLQKPCSSGVLQQRSKTIAVAAIAGTSRKKLKGSSSGNVGSVRPVSKAKALRRSKTQDSAGGDLPGQTGDGNSIPPLSDEPNSDVVKSVTSTELCATPKRLKVASKASGRVRQRKQATWEVEEKAGSSTEPIHLSWSGNRTLPAQIRTKKAVLLSKLEKNVRPETNKFRPGILCKVKGVKKMSQQVSSNMENVLPKQDSPQGIINLIAKMPVTKDIKPSASTPTKQTSSSCVEKDWVRSKASTRCVIVKSAKIDVAAPGPSSDEPGAAEPKHTSISGCKPELKFKSNVLRSLEKGSKSRLLCPVRRRSNEGKKARKNVERKSSCIENASITPTASGSRPDLNDAN